MNIEERKTFEDKLYKKWLKEIINNVNKEEFKTIEVLNRYGWMPENSYAEDNLQLNYILKYAERHLCYITYVKKEIITYNDMYDIINKLKSANKFKNCSFLLNCLKIYEKKLLIHHPELRNL